MSIRFWVQNQSFTFCFLHEIKDEEQYPFIVFDGEQLKIYEQLYQTNAIQGLYKVDEGGAFFNISNSATPNKNLGCCTLQ